VPFFVGGVEKIMTLKPTDCPTIRKKFREARLMIDSLAGVRRVFELACLHFAEVNATLAEPFDDATALEMHTLGLNQHFLDAIAWAIQPVSCDVESQLAELKSHPHSVSLEVLERRSERSWSKLVESGAVAAVLSVASDLRNEARRAQAVKEAARRTREGDITPTPHPVMGSAIGDDGPAVEAAASPGEKTTAEQLAPEQGTV
jgi:hypothetical protein